MSLAWFTPLPPVRSGIAQYSSEMLAQVGRTHVIDVFTSDAGQARPDGVRGVFGAQDFVWKQAQVPYDLVVYQLGNATCHDYMWAYLARYPGLVVLHDGQLHHARARSLLHHGRPDDYRAELAFDHPSAPPDVAELGIQGLLGTATYFWPMLRVPLMTARLVAVHNAWLAGDLGAAFPSVRFETIRMGVTDPRPLASPRARERVLERHGLPPDAVVFAAFGGVTPEKRIAEILSGFPSVVAVEPAAQLLLIGAPVPHYDAVAGARNRGIADHVTLTDYVDDAELPTYLAAADVCLCLRWPSAGETSASWLRCLAAGKPTVITDLAHMAEVPTLITRGAWSPSHLGSLGAQTRGPDPVAISIDILDEHDSLALAMRRLARDHGLRRRLGERAREYWAHHHTIEHMTEDYERTLAAAATIQPSPAAVSLPSHFREDGTGRARELLRPFGAAPDFLTPLRPDEG